MINIMLYVPTVVVRYFNNILNLTKNVYTVTFSAFPGSHTIHVFNHIKVGLVIDPVDGPISQQPGPIKMHRVTRYLWSYIRNYNRIHY